jgi:diguanylate cyclase (GGDEF)-like protein
MLPSPVSPDQSLSYRESLLLVTRYGAWTGVVYEAVFVVYYGMNKYPLPLVLIDLLSCLLSLLAVWLSRAEKRQLSAAILLSVALYLSSIVSSLYTGGINASSIIWLPFIPVAGAMVAGRKMGICLSLLCLLSVGALFVLNSIMGIDLTIQPTTELDRLIDLSLVLLAITAMAWYNESTKKLAVKQLEEVRVHLNELAAIDPLTGAYNRRQFFNRSHQLFENKQDPHGETSILMLDIDRFKPINDTHGHAVGDQVLVGMVRLIAGALRKQDVLARLGGEEFVIYLPETNLDAAGHIAERLRALIETTPIQTDAGALLITVSLGVAWATKTTSLSIEDVVRQADSAMYQAKNGGRNRVEVWKTSEQITSSPAEFKS